MYHLRLVSSRLLIDLMSFLMVGVDIMIKIDKSKKIFILIGIFLSGLILMVFLFEYLNEKRDLARMAIQKANSEEAIVRINNIVNEQTSNKEKVSSEKSKNLSYIQQTKDKAPLNSFNVLYFDTREQRILAESVVQDIDVSYAWSEEYNTPSEDFGAYWVGKINFAKDTNKVIVINLSQAVAQVIIDNKLLFQGDSSIKIPIQFSKGEHLIEVKYFNNWHTTEFSLTLKSTSDFSQELLPRKPLSIPIIKQQRLPLQFDKSSIEAGVIIGDIPERYKVNPPKIVFASIYKASSSDAEVSVVLDKMASPVIVVLSAVYPTKWVVKDPSNNDIVKIIHSSETVVSLDSSKVVPIISQKLNGIFSYRDRGLGCHCAGGYFHCENLPLLPLINAMQMETKTLVYGYTLDHEASTLLVPKEIFDNTVNKLSEQLFNYQKQFAQCIATSSPNFESMVDEV